MLKRKGRPRIGLRVRSNPVWMGGINYILNWAKTLHYMPADERPHVYFLYSDERGREIAAGHADIVSGIRPFREASKLDLDMVFPATTLFETPFESPWAGWITDWQHRILPEMFDETEILQRDFHHQLFAAKAPFLVLSSQMAIDDTGKFIDSKTAPMGKLHFPAIINDEACDVKQTLEHYGLPEKFFIVCNQFWKHKNHMLVLKALKKLADQNIKCVFTGSTSDHRWPDFFETIEAFIKENNLSSSVYLLGPIPRKDQVDLMKACLAFIQPSLFEGWSTVVEEARALNKPILLSRFPVHIEQSFEKCRLFEPDNADELASLMREFWDDAPSSESEPINNAWLENHREYVICCAGEFVRIAGRVKECYDPEIHETKKVFLSLILSLIGKGEPEIPKELHQRVWDGIRLAFQQNPKQLLKFLELVKQDNPELLEMVKDQIFLPVVQKFQVPQRNAYITRMEKFFKVMNEGLFTRKLKRLLTLLNYRL